MPENGAPKTQRTHLIVPQRSKPQKSTRLLNTTCEPKADNSSRSIRTERRATKNVHVSLDGHNDSTCGGKMQHAEAEANMHRRQTKATMRIFPEICYTRNNCTIVSLYSCGKQIFFERIFFEYPSSTSWPPSWPPLHSEKQVHHNWESQKVDAGRGEHRREYIISTSEKFD